MVKWSEMQNFRETKLYPADNWKRTRGKKKHKKTKFATIEKRTKETPKKNMRFPFSVGGHFHHKGSESNYKEFPSTAGCLVPVSFKKICFPIEKPQKCSPLGCYPFAEISDQSLPLGLVLPVGAAKQFTRWRKKFPRHKSRLLAARPHALHCRTAHGAHKKLLCRGQFQYTVFAAARH